MARSACLRACACVCVCEHMHTHKYALFQYCSQQLLRSSYLPFEPSEKGSVVFTCHLTRAMFVSQFLTCSLTLATIVSVYLTCLCTRATFVHVVSNCLYVSDICACRLGLTVHPSDVCAWNQVTFMFVVLPCTCRCVSG